MPLLTVRRQGGDRRIPFEPGRTLRRILDATDIRVRTGCNGQGACGLCRVRVLEGRAGEPSPTERLSLGEERLEQGVRLACLTEPLGDISIEILAEAPPSPWRSLDPETPSSCRPPSLAASGPGADPARSLGVAVDLGTTHIRVSLHDLARGRRLCGRAGLNPQADLGADVMTRLMAGAESAERAKVLKELVLDAVGEALWDMAARDGVDPRRVGRLVLVGNTAMLALLGGRNLDLLLRPEHWARPIDCLPDDMGEWAAAWGLAEGAAVEVAAPLGGFVGSDLLAGVLATGLAEGEPGALFIDFGTNSEIALWDGRSLLVTSAAGGPAFEGSGIGCGLPAEPGAIRGVSCVETGFSLTVIGGEAPRGLCGSGLVDLVACLLRTGRLDPLGRFAGDAAGESVLVAPGDPGIILTKRDVDVFQRAKAAIGAGVEVLLSRAGLRPGDLRRVCLGGAFGRYLDVGSAMETGLLPDMEPGLVELGGDTALAGCERLLYSPDGAAGLRELAGRATLVSLSQCPEFGELFMKHLYLRRQ